MVFLAAVVAGSLLLGPHNALPGRGTAALPIDSLPERPILQVELARDAADLRAILDVGDRAANIEDARAGNAIDSWLFIPGYAGLLAVIGLALHGSSSPRWKPLILAAIVLAAVAAGADWRENVGIERALDHFEHGRAFQDGDALSIRGPSIVKWLLLVVVLAGYGAAALAERPWWRQATGLVLLAGAASLLVWFGPYCIDRFL